MLDSPHGGCEINLLPAGTAHLAGTRHGKNEKLEGELRHRGGSRTTNRRERARHSGRGQRTARGGPGTTRRKQGAERVTGRVVDPVPFCNRETHDHAHLQAQTPGGFGAPLRKGAKDGEEVMHVDLADATATECREEMTLEGPQPVDGVAPTGKRDATKVEEPDGDFGKARRRLGREICRRVVTRLHATQVLLSHSASLIESENRVDTKSEPDSTPLDGEPLAPRLRAARRDPQVEAKTIVVLAAGETRLERGCAQTRFGWSHLRSPLEMRREPETSPARRRLGSGDLGLRVLDQSGECFQPALRLPGHPLRR